MTIPVAVLGASGLAGGELVRLLDAHPDFEIVHLGAHRSEGERLGAMHPHLSAGDRTLGPLDPDAVPDVDVAFLALPHGASAVPAMALAGRDMRVVDLGSDFRMDTNERYREAYGDEHPFPDELGAWTYGLPELFGESLAGARKVAAPGCYPTSVILALAPLLAEGLIAPAPVTVAAMSGVTGAGRSAKPHLTFVAIDGGLSAYGVLTHRHRPEIEQGLAMASGVEPTVLFTPHLVPMARGILSTCHAPVATGVGEADLTAALADAYDHAPFVTVTTDAPHTRPVVGSNRCVIAAHVDPRTGQALVFAAEDNLLKGAAGQAVQCANLMFGFPETTGLPLAGWAP